MEIDKRGKNAFKDINFFNKIIEENVCRLKKRTLINIQKAYKTHTEKKRKLDQKRNFSLYIIIKKKCTEYKRNTKS